MCRQVIKKIYVKQSLDYYVSFLEIQVLGNGPYKEDAL